LIKEIDRTVDVLIAAHVREAPPHDGLPGSTLYDVRALRFVQSDTDESALELEASTQLDYVTLKFTGVEDLRLPGHGTPPEALRLHIQDTSGCPSGSHCIPAVRVGGWIDSEFGFWATAVKVARRVSARELM